MKNSSTHSESATSKGSKSHSPLPNALRSFADRLRAGPASPPPQPAFHIVHQPDRPAVPLQPSQIPSEEECRAFLEQAAERTKSDPEPRMAQEVSSRRREEAKTRDGGRPSQKVSSSTAGRASFKSRESSTRTPNTMLRIPVHVSPCPPVRPPQAAPTLRRVSNISGTPAPTVAADRKRTTGRPANKSQPPTTPTRAPPPPRSASSRLRGPPETPSIRTHNLQKPSSGFDGLWANPRTAPPTPTKPTRTATTATPATRAASTVRRVVSSAAAATATTKGAKRPVGAASTRGRIKPLTAEEKGVSRPSRASAGPKPKSRAQSPSRVRPKLQIPRTAQTAQTAQTPQTPQKRLTTQTDDPVIAEDVAVAVEDDELMPWDKEALEASKASRTTQALKHMPDGAKAQFGVVGIGSVVSDKITNSNNDNDQGRRMVRPPAAVRAAWQAAEQKVEHGYADWDGSEYYFEN